MKTILIPAALTLSHVIQPFEGLCTCQPALNFPQGATSLPVNGACNCRTLWRCLIGEQYGIYYRGDCPRPGKRPHG